MNNKLYYKWTEILIRLACAMSCEKCLLIPPPPLLQGLFLKHIFCQFIIFMQDYYELTFTCWWRTTLKQSPIYKKRGCHGHDRMVAVITTTCAISAYHHCSCEFEFGSWRGVLDTALCDKACQWLAADLWFSLCTPVSSTNKSYCHDIPVI